MSENNNFIPPTTKTTLIIAEKDKQIPAIVDVMPKPHEFKEGYVITGGGIVTSLRGHIVKLCEPQDYNPEYKKWDLNLLPILAPKKWKCKPEESKAFILTRILNLLKISTDVIHAADPGREGQLIVDEVLEYLGNTKPVRRVQFPELNKKSIIKAFQNIEPNENYKNLLDAAKGRQRADQLLGINGTRLFTKKAQELGYMGVVSLGRVQTPVLRLIVDREFEIQNFKEEKYLKINAFWGLNIKNNIGSVWIPRKEQGDLLDINNRLSNMDICNQIILDVKSANKGVVTKFTSVVDQEEHPLPHEIISMYGVMSKKYRVSTEQTLLALQSLYDNGYMSYPRTDNPYYSESKFDELITVINNLKSINHPEISGWASNANSKIRSRAWNDNPKPGKVIEHTGLSPTEDIPDFNQLNDIEKKVYFEAVKMYILQFYPKAEINKKAITITVDDKYDFKANSKKVVKLGWLDIYGYKNPENQIPDVKEKDVLDLNEINYSEEKTPPPSRYTVETLLNTMKSIHKTIKDLDAKNTLKNIEGLGTAATTGLIVTTLFDRNFMKNENEKIKPTELGIWLITSAPEKAKSPILTAKWENALEQVANGKVPLSVFESKMDNWINALVDECKNIKFPKIPDDIVKKSKEDFLKKYPSKNNYSSSKKTTTTGKATTKQKFFGGNRTGKSFSSTTSKTSTKSTTKGKK